MTIEAAKASLYYNPYKLNMFNKINVLIFPTMLIIENILSLLFVCNFIELCDASAASDRKPSVAKYFTYLGLYLISQNNYLQMCFISSRCSEQ